jgi:hypothetical protein
MNFEEFTGTNSATSFALQTFLLHDNPVAADRNAADADDSLILARELFRPPSNSEEWISSDTEFITLICLTVADNDKNAGRRLASKPIRLDRPQRPSLVS